MNLIKRIKSNKLLYFLAVLIIGLLIVLVVRIAYAYLAAFVNEGIGNASVLSDKVDEFKIIDGEPLNLNATPTTLPENGTNLVSTTRPKVSLRANSTRNTATYNYYVYLNITNNTFTYSTSNNTPEIILTVINPAGEEVTNIEGLTYGTYNGVTGYDVTTYRGLITIAEEYTIESNSSDEATVDEWNISLTYLNLNEDQSSNFGNSMNVKTMVQKDKYVPTVVLADYIKGLYTTDGENGLYLHDADLANGANDGSYRYAGASEDVNNYVCFASDEEICPDDNLYRIIGVFGDNVKLIKSDYATSTQLGTDGDYYDAYKYGSSPYKGTNYANIASYYWNATNENIWENSALNTINLNTNYIAYLNGINTKWASMIAETTWQVGGNTDANIRYVAVNEVYQNEIVNPAENTTYTDEIGLIYVSDYGYAAAPSDWTIALQDYSELESNWMYMGLYEWTIFHPSDRTGRAFFVHYSGDMDLKNVGGGDSAVRPSFYLKSTVQYSGVGTGSSTAPYRITLAA